jgi:hypothetical protein
VACRLKAGIFESERASIARQRPDSHVSYTTQVMLSWQRPGESLFSQQREERFHDNGGINYSIRCSLVGKPSSYGRGQNCTHTCVEAGSNTSTVTLRVVGKFQIWDSKIRSRVPRDSNPRKTALARASSLYKRQIRPLVREGAPQNQDRNCQTVINIWS